MHMIFSREEHVRPRKPDTSLSWSLERKKVQALRSITSQNHIEVRGFGGCLRGGVTSPKFRGWCIQSKSGFPRVQEAAYPVLEKQHYKAIAVMPPIPLDLCLLQYFLFCRTGGGCERREGGPIKQAREDWMVSFIVG